MKSNNKLFFRSLLIVLFSLTITVSCDNDFLERNDPAAPTTDGFFKTADDFVLGVDGIYASLFNHDYMSQFWGGYYFYGFYEYDGVTDNAVSQANWYGGISNLGLGSATPLTGGILHYKWDYGLKSLVKINTMLSYMPDIDFGSEGGAKWEAELRFLRGYLYADMGFLYGGVPLFDKPLTPEEAASIKRSTQDEVMNFAFDDLKFAAENLDVTPNKNQIGRPTSNAAYAALGTAYMYVSNYQKAKEAFEKVVLNEGASVDLAHIDEWEGLFRGTQENNKEILWSIQFTGDGEGQGDYVPYGPIASGNGPFYSGWGGMPWTKDLISSFQTTDGKFIDDPSNTLFDANDPLKNRDPRLRKSFYFPGDVFSQDFPDDVLTETQLNPFFGTFDFNDLENNGLYGCLPRKMVPMTTQQADNTAAAETMFSNTADIILLRYTDVLLLHAEASNQLNDQTAALASLNKVRSRANMPTISSGMTKTELDAVIMNERRVEFVGEAKRFYDLKRRGILKQELNSNLGWDAIYSGAKYKDHYDLWPIPQLSVDINGFNQNPGY